MLGDGSITIVRHVAVWFYAVSGLVAAVAFWSIARRRLLGLGVQPYAAGVAINGLWELLLFTVWGRRYETVVPTVAQAVYQSLTEFGPPLLLAIVLLDVTGTLDLDAWRESERAREHRLVEYGASGVFTAVGTLVFVTAVSSPSTLTTAITVYRDIGWAYFAIEWGLAVVVLAVVLWQRNRTALLLFAVLGVFNVLFEVVGLVGGFRSYEGLVPVASVLIGICESGTAAAIAWLVVDASSMANEPEFTPDLG